MTTGSSEQGEGPRQLQQVDSPIRYVIANANSNIDPDKDVTDECEIRRDGCNNVKVVMALFLKGEERGFDIITLIAQVLQSLAGLEESGKRLLESDEEQRHHRKLLLRILGLDPNIFETVGYRGIRGLDPTTSPSVSPSQVPSATPSDKPSKVPSASPSSMPTPSTLSPTVKPTPGPTEQPTSNPTPGPTERPTRSPTQRPTPGPTLDPTLFPTPGPTPQPVIQPTNFPTYRPNTSWPTYTPWTNYPTYNPYGSGPTGCPGFQEDATFRDDSGDGCSWYESYAQGCPDGLGTQYGGTCGVYSTCYAADRCCHCSQTPGCVDDDTFTDSGGDPCSWYQDYPAGCPDGLGTQYPGECVTGSRECTAAESCCHCQ